MTENQLKEQLQRLKIFGNLHDGEFSEYSRALSNIGYTDFVNGISWLITNHGKRYYPLPSEIINATKQVAFEKLQKNNNTSWGVCGTVESNAEFWKAWHMIEKLPKEKWEMYYKEILGNAPIVEGKAACDYYISVQNKIKEELCNGKTKQPKQTKQVVASDDLPF